MDRIFCVVITINDAVMPHPALPFFIQVDISALHQHRVTGSYQALEQVDGAAKAQDCILLGMLLDIGDHLLGRDVKVLKARFDHLFYVDLFAHPAPIA